MSILRNLLSYSGVKSPSKSSLPFLSEEDIKDIQQALHYPLADEELEELYKGYKEELEP